MNQEILEFIKRRFPVDCNWTSQNCYYFSLILKDRFPEGKIYYDIIPGHFVFKYKSEFYDWTGSVKPFGLCIEWEKFAQYDELQKDVIIRDCLL